MSYTTADFSESLNRVHITANTVERVIAAWGKGGGQGEDAGHYRWSDDGATEWSGGFLVRLADGRYAYVTGWCDYTGWGCQDGAEVHHFDVEPSIAQLRSIGNEEDRNMWSEEGSGAPEVTEWDLEPADLNKWLADGAKDPLGD